MAYRVWVLTEWVQVSSERNEMKVARDYPAEWSDVTGQPHILPDPNILIAEGVVSEALLDSLIAVFGDDLLMVEEL